MYLFIIVQRHITQFYFILMSAASTVMAFRYNSVDVLNDVTVGGAGGRQDALEQLSLDDVLRDFEVHFAETLQGPRKHQQLQSTDHNPNNNNQVGYYLTYLLTYLLDVTSRYSKLQTFRLLLHCV